MIISFCIIIIEIGTIISIHTTENTDSLFYNTSDIKCIFGLSIVSATYISTFEVQCKTPPLIRDLSDPTSLPTQPNSNREEVTFVMKVDGIIAVTSTEKVIFTYISPTVVTSLYPVAGSSSGGTKVYITLSIDTAFLNSMNIDTSSIENSLYNSIREESSNPLVESSVRILASLIESKTPISTLESPISCVFGGITVSASIVTSALAIGLGVNDSSTGELMIVCVAPIIESSVGLVDLIVTVSLLIIM